MANLDVVVIDAHQYTQEALIQIADVLDEN